MGRSYNHGAVVHPDVTPKAIRRIILEQAKRAKVGHIGSALSVADILAVLLSGRLESPGAPDRQDADRDRFILSKGHAALALYAALHLQGRLGRDILDTYCGNASLLGVHPEKELSGIDFSTGSLGQGLSMGTGAALAMKLKGNPSRVRVLLSDAELNEGSTWEAVMFAAHHKLGNLDVIVDLNGQQALGKTKDILDLSPQVARFESFGWRVRECDGHDPDALLGNLEDMTRGSDLPQVLLARTVCGKGVGYMEAQVKWHYWPMSDAEYAVALSDVERMAA